MPDFPVLINTDRIIISAASPDSIGRAMNAMGLTTSSSAWPTANKAIFIPFSVSGTITIVKMFVENGATVSGNIDVGIYDAGGARLVSMGSTAQAGVSAIQEFDIADTTLNPGLYFLAVAMDNATGTINCFTPSAQLARAIGVMEKTTAFVLPATVTWVGITSNRIPCVFATLRTLV